MTSLTLKKLNQKMQNRSKKKLTVDKTTLFGILLKDVFARGAERVEIGLFLLVMHVNVEGGGVLGGHELFSFAGVEHVSPGSDNDVQVTVGDRAILFDRCTVGNKIGASEDDC